MSTRAGTAATKLARRSDLATAAVFCLALAAPSLDWLVRGIDSTVSQYENRRPGAFPKLARSAGELERLPKRLETWHADHIGLRAELLAARSDLVWRVFGRTPAPIAELTRERVLFITDLDARSVHRGTRPMSRRDLEGWQRAIESRARFCAEHGAQYRFVVVPNKESVYADFVPPSWRHPIGPTRFEQFLARCATSSTARSLLFDLRPSLAAAREADQGDDLVYYRLGTHWSDRGAVAATHAILDDLRRFDARVRTLERERLELVAAEVESDDWRSRLYLGSLDAPRAPVLRPVEGVSQVPTPRDSPVLTFEGPDRDAPTLLCFHDSCGTALRAPLPAAFSRTQFLWSNFDPKLVTSTRPDVVLDLFVERILAAPPPAPLDRSLDATLARDFENGERLFAWPADARRFLAGEGCTLAAQDAGFALDHGMPPQPLALPQIALDSRSDVLLRLEIDADSAGSVLVFTPRANSPTYSRETMRTFSFRAGGDVVFCLVPWEPARGRLGLILQSSARTHVVRALEARRLR